MQEKLNRVKRKVLLNLKFLLIKYTILEPMSLKISQIDFSLIQHLQVDSYELRCHGVSGSGTKGQGHVEDVR